jgi:hypothetical protein
MTQPIELYDWIVNNNRVRGSFMGDNGEWLCGANNNGDLFVYNPESEKPVYFDPVKRIIQTANGNLYILNKKTVCKALNLHTSSEKILSTLVK